MSEQQKNLLRMLIELKEILEEEKIEFFLIGGSALGAVRHKGFIPWDDDIDLGLLREDFERLETYIYEKNLRSIKYIPIGKNKIQTEPIGRVYLKSEIENGEIKSIIDIFPLDNVPDSYFCRKIQLLFSQIYHLAVYQKPARNRGKLKKILSYFLLLILSKKMLRLLEKVSKKIFIFKKSKNSKYIANIFGIKGYYKEIIPREYIKKLKKIEFENIELNISDMYEEYLTHFYDDYKKLPEKKERKGKHSYIIFKEN